MVLNPVQIQSTCVPTRGLAIQILSKSNPLVNSHSSTRYPNPVQIRSESGSVIAPKDDHLIVWSKIWKWFYFFLTIDEGSWRLKRREPVGRFNRWLAVAGTHHRPGRANMERSLKTCTASNDISGETAETMDRHLESVLKGGAGVKQEEDLESGRKYKLNSMKLKLELRTSFPWDQAL